MRSSYKRIGDFIELVDVRNKGLQVTNLVGLSITKQFIKSVANTNGTDMENYKIIRKNQFACSIMQVRRDKKMPLALFADEEPAIISQAYPVFEITNGAELLPEYLMMWFTRSEFDRHACFLAVGGVRGSLEWEDFLEMELPVPSLDTQREIVKEYNTIVNRITLNEQLNQKLEETAQALYKYWFVDFEFPNESGQPYKSSGGKMVFNEELDKDIPEGWSPSKLENVTVKITDGTHSTVIDNPDGEYYLLSCKNIKNNSVVITDKERRIDKPTLDYLRKRTGLQKNDLLITTVGTIGEVAQIDSEFIPYELQRSVAIIRPDITRISHNYLYQFIKSRWFKKQTEDKISGSVQRCLFLGAINEMIVLVPNETVQNQFDNLNKKIITAVKIINSECLSLKNFENILFAKMSKTETLHTLQAI